MRTCVVPNFESIAKPERQVMQTGDNQPIPVPCFVVTISTLKPQVGNQTDLHLHLKETQGVDTASAGTIQKRWSAASAKGSGKGCGRKRIQQTRFLASR